MKSRSYYNFIIAGLVLLSLCVGLLLNFAIRKRETLRIDLGKGSITSLSPKTRQVLAKLPEPVKVTYYVTERRRMPTAMRNVGADVQALLRELKRAGGKNFTYEVVYPRR